VCNKSSWQSNTRLQSLNAWQYFLYSYFVSKITSYVFFFRLVKGQLVHWLMMNVNSGRGSPNPQFAIRHWSCQPWFVIPGLFFRKLNLTLSQDISVLTSRWPVTLHTVRHNRATLLSYKLETDKKHIWKQFTHICHNLPGEVKLNSCTQWCRNTQAYIYIYIIYIYQTPIFVVLLVLDKSSRARS
jgi:hypothetical protein